MSTQIYCRAKKRGSKFQTVKKVRNRQKKEKHEQICHCEVCEANRGNLSFQVLNNVKIIKYFDLLRNFVSA
ncbi:MAG: hypothetical protein CW335_08320, partial [Clostridiales bacterium]|nr:hypothetical protein [Clostridiales bacterium]